MVVSAYARAIPSQCLPTRVICNSRICYAMPGTDSGIRWYQVSCACTLRCCYQPTLSSYTIILHYHPTISPHTKTPTLQPYTNNLRHFSPLLRSQPTLPPCAISLATVLRYHRTRARCRF
eukprot:2604387-Rhodomonas_salina.4